MSTLKGRKIAVLATDGFEQSELEVPRDMLREAGAEVHVVSLKGDEIMGWKGKGWERPAAVDRLLSDVSAEDYDALVLPGGQINPDLLRVEKEAIDFIRAFHDTGKVIGAICHAPWLLVEAGVVHGREMTSYHSIRTDVENAGARWTDAEVVTDNGIVTSRNPGDLEAFCGKLVEEISEGRHARKAA